MYGTGTINDQFEFTQLVSTSNDASDQVPLTQPSACTNAPNNTTNEHQYTRFETHTIRCDTFSTPTAPRATPCSSVHNSHHEDTLSNPQSPTDQKDPPADTGADSVSQRTNSDNNDANNNDNNGDTESKSDHNNINDRTDQTRAPNP